TDTTRPRHVSCPSRPTLASAPDVVSFQVRLAHLERRWVVEAVSMKGFLLAFVAAIAVLSVDRAIARDGAPLPRTETGARLQEFLGTFGKADTAGIRAFVDQAYADEYKAAVPIEARIQLYL